MGTRFDYETSGHTGPEVDREAAKVWPPMMDPRHGDPKGADGCRCSR